MAWKVRLLSFVRKYGKAAKVITTSVLNVAAPGSGALIELVEKAFDTAEQTAEKDREEKLLEATQRNTAELERAIKETIREAGYEGHLLRDPNCQRESMCKV